MHCKVLLVLIFSLSLLAFIFFYTESFYKIEQSKEKEKVKVLLVVPKKREVIIKPTFISDTNRGNPNIIRDMNLLNEILKHSVSNSMQQNHAITNTNNK